MDENDLIKKLMKDGKSSNEIDTQRKKVYELRNNFMNKRRAFKKKVPSCSECTEA